MKRYACAVEFKAGSNNEVLVGKCLKVLHGYQCKHQINQIGVTFPDFDDVSIGSTIAFISSDERCLQVLLEQNYFLQMQRLQKFCIHDIALVPECVSEVRFMRDRKRDKQCAGGRQRGIRRGQRKAENAGHEYLPRSTQNNVIHQIQGFHNIPITSSGNTSQVFYLRIQKFSVDERIDGSFTSYGLGNKDALRGTVPERIFTNK
ncbi:type I-F CRISPR-associated endoribonuclease Cas6/Csy4 [Endozoicomonadaceae bacterium StTr2]